MYRDSRYGSKLTKQATPPKSNRWYGHCVQGSGVAVGTWSGVVLMAGAAFVRWWRASFFYLVSLDYVIIIVAPEELPSRSSVINTFIILGLNISASDSIDDVDSIMQTHEAD